MIEKKEKTKQKLEMSLVPRCRLHKFSLGKSPRNTCKIAGTEAHFTGARMNYLKYPGFNNRDELRTGKWDGGGVNTMIH